MAYSHLPQGWVEFRIEWESTTIPSTLTRWLREDPAAPKRRKSKSGKHPPEQKLIGYEAGEIARITETASTEARQAASHVAVELFFKKFGPVAAGIVEKDLELYRNVPWPPSVRDCSSDEEHGRRMISYGARSQGIYRRHPSMKLPIREFVEAGLVYLRNDMIGDARLNCMWLDCVEAHLSDSTTVEPIPALDDEGIMVLMALKDAKGRLLTLNQIEELAEVSRDTAHKRVNQLIEIGFARRPNGEKSGATFTEAGIEWLKSLAKQK